jgi:hypothetical protein
VGLGEFVTFMAFRNWLISGSVICLCAVFGRGGQSLRMGTGILVLMRSFGGKNLRVRGNLELRWPYHSGRSL